MSMPKCSTCQIELTESAARARSEDLAQQASEILATAKQSRSYADFNRALSMFETASQLSPETEQARDGLSATKLAFANATWENADFELGLVIADAICPDHQEIITKLRAGRDERITRSKRLCRMKIVISIGAVIYIVLCSAAGAYINTERVRAITGETRANERAARAEEEVQRLTAEAAAK